MKLLYNNWLIIKNLGEDITLLDYLNNESQKDNTIIENIELDQDGLIYVTTKNKNVFIINSNTGEINYGLSTITFELSDEQWTNKDVIVTARANLGINQKLYMSLDGENWDVVDGKEGRRTMINNGTVYAKVLEGTNLIKMTTKRISNIDKTEPVIEVTASSETNEIEISGTDTNGSGIIGYYYSKTNSTPSVTADGWQAITTTTSLSNQNITELDWNQTYYVWLKDTAGNVSNVKSVKIINKDYNSTDVSLGQIVDYRPVVGDGGTNPTDQSNAKRNNAASDYTKSGAVWQIMKIENDTISITTSSATTGTVYIYNFDDNRSFIENYIDSVAKYYYGKKDSNNNAISTEIRELKYADKDDFLSSQLLTTSSDFWLSSYFAENDYYGATNFKCGVRFVTSENSWEGKFVTCTGKRAYYSTGYYSTSKAIRPIVTIPVSNIDRIENNVVYIK